MNLSKTQAYALVLSALLAVVGPACSFGILAHDLLVLGQDAACIERLRREGNLPPHPLDIEACGVPVRKLGTLHPRAWVYDDVFDILVFETDPVQLQAMQLSRPPGEVVLRRHGAYAAVSLMPLISMCAWTVLARWRRRRAGA